MKNFILSLIGLMFWLLLTSNVIQTNNEYLNNKFNSYGDSYTRYVLDVYTESDLNDLIDFTVFNQAMIGYNSIGLTNKNVITIIDYSKPSVEKRLFIIDVENRKLLYQTFVAHGKYSGLNFAAKFSNKSGSLKSSLGFFITAETYYGKHGYSLRLDGLEKGINDNARKRALVIHGAEYVSDEFIKKHNRLGRSWGCPAVSEELSDEIIDLIKNGSCLFIYANNIDYLKQSAYLKFN